LSVIPELDYLKGTNWSQCWDKSGKMIVKTKNGSMKLHYKDGEMTIETENGLITKNVKKTDWEQYAEDNSGVECVGKRIVLAGVSCDDFTEFIKLYPYVFHNGIFIHTYPEHTCVVLPKDKADEFDAALKKRFTNIWVSPA
jgi:hypothetical protein